MKTHFDSRFWLTLVVIGIAAGLRFVEHPVNFTPIGAMALFAGATLTDRRWALILPLSAMLLTDLALGFHPTMPFVYGALAAVVLLGWQIRQHRRQVLWVGGAAVLTSVLFFVVTNLGVWIIADWYPTTWAGLTKCFTVAIPFFRNTVAADLVFSGAFFGAFALAEAMLPGPAAASTTNDS